jgi:hypothetical protein
MLGGIPFNTAVQADVIYCLNEFSQRYFVGVSAHNLFANFPANQRHLSIGAIVLPQQTAWWAVVIQLKRGDFFTNPQNASERIGSIIRRIPVAITEFGINLVEAAIKVPQKREAT